MELHLYGDAEVVDVAEVFERVFKIVEVQLVEGVGKIYILIYRIVYSLVSDYFQDTKAILRLAIMLLLFHFFDVFHHLFLQIWNVSSYHIPQLINIYLIVVMD